MVEKKIILDDVLSVPMAAELWGITEDMIKRYAREGKFSSTEAKKMGKNWVITRQGMKRIFGERQHTGD